MYSCCCCRCRCCTSRVEMSTLYRDIDLVGQKHLYIYVILISSITDNLPVPLLFISYRVCTLSIEVGTRTPSIYFYFILFYFILFIPSSIK